MSWHQFVVWILGWVGTHSGTDEFILGVIVTAFVVHMPPPGSPLNWATIYTWFYNGAQQIVNSGRPPHPTLPASTEPEAKK